MLCHIVWVNVFTYLQRIFIKRLVEAYEVAKRMWQFV